MSLQRSHLTSNPKLNMIKTVLPDLWTSHSILAPNEYSSVAIGIHSCLVRCLGSDHLARTFYQTPVLDLDPKDFIHRLNEIEKKLKDNCHLEIERCSIIARLRRYLEDNRECFKKILEQIKNDLHQCMYEYSLKSSFQSNIEFIQQCNQRNQAAVKREIANRMQRLQFYDYNEIGKPLNLINLQNRTRTDLHLIITNIKSDVFNQDFWKNELKILLNNSFFIVQHPTPAVVTLSTPKNNIVSAKLSCQVVSLFDTSNSEIILENIVPVVYCLSKSDQMKCNGGGYQQSPLYWKTYSTITISNERKEFSCAEISEIILNETSTVVEGRSFQKIKIRHAPFVYEIAFNITVKILMLDDQKPFQHIIVIRSAPFGLITNTSQAKLLASVFLEDFKSWKSMLKSLPITISDMNSSISMSMNLTMDDIIDGVRRYFIHKTGIHPKHWVMPYIKNELDVMSCPIQNLMNEHFQNKLTKFFAQIDYMAEHALLSLFHDDGLFLGICDSDLIHRILCWKKQNTTENICAMRFGSIHRMTSTKNVGVRIDLVHQSNTRIQNYTFDSDKIPLEFGSFIARIALCEASKFESIIYNITESDQNQATVMSISLKTFVQLYTDDKLHELCPQKNKYLPIWYSFYNENQKPEDCTSSTISQIATVTTTNDNSSDHFGNYQSHTISQTSMFSEIQTSQKNNFDMLQYALPCSHTPQNQEHIINSTPIVIIISSNLSWTMSDDNVSSFISSYLPQYSQLPFRSDRIHRFYMNSLPSQLFDTQSQDFSSNS